MYGLLSWCIMIIDLKKIKRSGKDSSEFFFEYSPEAELIDLPNADIVLPIKVFGTVTLTGEHSAVAYGQVDFSIKGECTRCLEDTVKPMLLDFDENFDQEDPNGYPVKNDTVDLSKVVDDLIMINSPMNFLCDEDCKGICVGCGSNLNKQECKCKK